ncbi:MAG: sensor histidine kinase [Betaproteobacteria bacterium]|nr:MAG: sensor histidine kinase [Betaproteobacteria bacterium]
MSEMPRRLWLQLSLRTRVSLVLTLLAAGCMLGLGWLWLADTRAAVREEVEAASRVAAQWLAVTAEGAARGDAAWSEARLLAHLAAVGRVRANALEAHDTMGTLRYASPPSAYKAWRAAPEWFERLLAPTIAPRRFAAGTLRLTLRPDPSRAVLDAWDDLQRLAAIAGGLLAALFAASWLALHLALRPLGEVMAALNHAGAGRFEARLPVYSVAELGRLARAFNGMADRLQEAVRQNIALERDRELARLLQIEREAERRAIARELHDELAQSITAVRAMAGALSQESHAPATRQAAGLILGVTDEMQQGVRNLLHRLRPAPVAGLETTLRGYTDAWRRHHAEPALQFECAADLGEVADAVQLAALRIVQEALTNVARHAGARRTKVSVARTADGLVLDIADDGCGICIGTQAAGRGCGLGLESMRERAVLLGGRVDIESDGGEGTRVKAWLPLNTLSPNPSPASERGERGESLRDFYGTEE